MWSWIAQDSDDPWVVDQCRIPDGVRLAVGERAPGIEGFRSSHREALAAQRIAEVGKQRKAVTSYTHVELVSMLSADPDAMRALVARELAGLLGEDAASERLRDTLRAVMNCHGNHEAAAVGWESTRTPSVPHAAGGRNSRRRHSGAQAETGTRLGVFRGIRRITEIAVRWHAMKTLTAGRPPLRDAELGRHVIRESPSVAQRREGREQRGELRLFIRR